MRISRRVAWGVLLSAILTAALLRQFHESTRQSPLLPLRSLLFFLLLILFLLFLRGWGQRQEFPYAGESLREFNLLSMVPLLIALIGEKWFSITFYSPVLAIASRAGLPESVLAALGLLLGGLGILAVAAALLPVFPRLRPLLRDYLSARSLLQGVAGTLAVLALLYGLLGGLLLILGGKHLYLLPWWFGSWGGIRFSGQALIALGEEIYYRGLLQSELIFLLPALGLRNPLAARVVGIGLTSTQFALEHISGDAPNDTSVFLYTLTVAILLGSLLVTVRSLYLCAFTHFALNLFVLRGGLQFTDQSGRPILDAGLYIVLYLILMTLLIYARFGPERREIARRRSRVVTPAAG